MSNSPFKTINVSRLGVLTTPRYVHCWCQMCLFLTLSVPLKSYFELNANNMAPMNISSHERHVHLLLFLLPEQPLNVTTKLGYQQHEEKRTRATRRTPLKMQNSATMFPYSPSTVARTPFPFRLIFTTPPTTRKPPLRST